MAGARYASPPDRRSRTKWRFARLQANVQAIELLIQNHYVYYKFYGNTAVAGLFAYGAWLLSLRLPANKAAHAAVLLTIAVLVAGSRDAFRRYHARAAELLGEQRDS